MLLGKPPWYAHISDRDLYSSVSFTTTRLFPLPFCTPRQAVSFIWCAPYADMDTRCILSSLKKVG